jgi:hypothetical protein
MLAARVEPKNGDLEEDEEAGSDLHGIALVSELPHVTTDHPCALSGSTRLSAGGFVLVSGIPTLEFSAAVHLPATHRQFGRRRGLSPTAKQGIRLHINEIQLSTTNSRVKRSFLFVSGYERAHLPEAFLDAPLLSKPFEPGELITTVRQLLCLSERSQNW